MTVGSDATWSFLDWDESFEKFSGHPRTGGSHAKTLRLGRELGVPLMHSLSQLSYWSALHLGEAGIAAMKVRGRMQEGMVADITIFNPEIVTDHATYKAGEQLRPSTGIPYVIVNGHVVVRNSKAKRLNVGQPIRYPAEDKPRHVPTSQEQWLNTHTIDSSPIAPKLKPVAPRADSKQSSVQTSKYADTEPGPLLASRTNGHDYEWWGDQPYHTLSSCSDWHEAGLATHR